MLLLQHSFTKFYFYFMMLCALSSFLLNNICTYICIFSWANWMYFTALVSCTKWGASNLPHCQLALPTQHIGTSNSPYTMSQLAPAMDHLPQGIVILPHYPAHSLQPQTKGLTSANAILATSSHFPQQAAPWGSSSDAFARQCVMLFFWTQFEKPPMRVVSCLFESKWPMVI